MSVVGNFFEMPHNALPKWGIVLTGIMLTAYMDESSHQAGTVVLAGYLGNKEQWEAFVPLWKKGLGPQRKRLHLKKLRWRASDEKLLNRLAPIPYECGLLPLISEVTDTHFADLLTTGLDKKFHKTYLIALMPLLLMTMQRVPETETIKFIFDQQVEYEGFARLIFHVLKDHKTPSGEPRLASIDFISQNMMTDPGDYLAYAITQTSRDPDSQRTKWCGRIITEIVLRDINPIYAKPRREDVREVIQFANQRDR